METRIKAAEDRLDKLEAGQKELSDRQVKIETEQAETRVYVKQIFERIDDIKLFVKGSQTPKSNSNKEWMDLFKWVLGGTIFIIVAAIFTKGGL